jgi:Cu-Zn family superoxide dismutase
LKSGEGILLKKIVALLCVLSVAVAAGVAGARGLPSSYVLPGAAVFPEGIDYWPAKGHYFVSSTTDGSVLRGEIGSPTAQAAFVAPTGVRFSAVGVAVDVKNELLYVAGGFAANVRVANANTGAVTRTFTVPTPGSFLNDAAVARGGDVFVTDSFNPILWRIPEGAPSGAAEAWLNYTGTPFQWVPGQFNANGIVETENGRFLIVSNLFTQELYRIDKRTKQVTLIDLHGQTVAGDGLELNGKTLYAVEPTGVAKIHLDAGYASGTVVSRTADPSFDSPTTAALARGRLLVVNSQFSRLGGTPVLPFRVSSIPAP